VAENHDPKPGPINLQAGLVKGPDTGRFQASLMLAVVVFVLDQASKFWVLEVQKFSPPGCLDLTDPLSCRKLELSSVFDLSMVWNRGVSFGMLQAGHDWARWALVGLSLVISGVFINWMRTADRRLTMWALGLVVGGALGNVVDRIRFGAVADFLDFSGPWFGWHLGQWPVGFPWVFNVADAGITIGAALLFLDFMLNGDGPPRK
jgi:signal peptidase II